MQMNPMQLIQMIRSGSNPSQLMLNILKQNMGNSPMGEQLLSMIQKNDIKGIEKYARNICQSQGKDFDTEFAAFRKQYGL